MNTPEALSSFIDDLEEDYYQRLYRIKGKDYAYQATLTKWCQASEWWNSLKPYERVDSFWNRKKLISIFWKEMN